MVIFEIIPYKEALINKEECIKLKIDVKFIEIKGPHNNPLYPKNILIFFCIFLKLI